MAFDVTAVPTCGQDFSSMYPMSDLIKSFAMAQGYDNQFMPQPLADSYASPEFGHHNSDFFTSVVNAAPFVPTDQSHIVSPVSAELPHHQQQEQQLQQQHQQQLQLQQAQQAQQAQVQQLQQHQAQQMQQQSHLILLQHLQQSQLHWQQMQQIQSVASAQMPQQPRPAEVAAPPPLTPQQPPQQARSPQVPRKKQQDRSQAREARPRTVELAPLLGGEMAAAAPSERSAEDAAGPAEARLLTPPASPTEHGELRVAVQNVVGELFRVELSQTSSVLDLKSRIEAIWEVPCDCQKLVLGTTVLEDDRAVASYREAQEQRCGSLDGSAGDCYVGEEELLLTVMASADDICSGSVQECCARLRELAKAAPRFCGFTAAPAEACLEHENVLVQEEALRALVRVAKKGSDAAAARARGSLRRWLPRLEGDLREFGVRALADEAGPGDEWALSMLIAGLADLDGGVRWAAVDALRKLLPAPAPSAAPCEAARAVAAGALALLEHSDAGVQESAAEALDVAAGKGDARSLQAVSGLLSHAQAGVRAAALRALSLLAGKGNAEATASVCRLLADPDAAVREAAVMALLQVSPPGHACAIAAAISRFSDPDDAVRDGAVDAVAQLAEPGHEDAVAAASRLLTHSVASTRSAAAEALAYLRAEEKGCLTPHKSDASTASGGSSAASDCHSGSAWTPMGAESIPEQAPQVLQVPQVPQAFAMPIDPTADAVSFAACAANAAARWGMGQAVDGDLCAAAQWWGVPSWSWGGA